MQFIVANVRTEVRSYVAPSSAALISVMLLDERLNYSKQQVPVSLSETVSQQTYQRTVRVSASSLHAGCLSLLYPSGHIGNLSIPYSLSLSFVW